MQHLSTARQTLTKDQFIGLFFISLNGLQLNVTPVHARGRAGTRWKPMISVIRRHLTAFAKGSARGCLSIIGWIRFAVRSRRATLVRL